MKSKKYAINKNLWLPIILAVVLVVLSVFCAMDEEWIMFFGFLFFAFLAVFVILIQPVVISFSSENIQIIYTIGVRETIPIKQIRKIYEQGNWFAGHSGWPVYVVVYPQISKKYFFANGELPKTRKIKKLLRMFYRRDFE